MKIVTYNVNSINARLENLLDFLRLNSPDIVLLQEIKTEFSGFPFFEIKAAGYEAKILGQKSYNGVAILSREKIEITAEGLPDFPDENARYLEAVTSVCGEKIRVASIYLPNGNPPYNNPNDDSKFAYKLRFMDALYNRCKTVLSYHENTVLGGDFNVIFKDEDVYNPEIFRNNALFREEVRRNLAAYLYLGFYDTFRTLYPHKNGYTYWDYSGGALAADLGMRIDYLLASPSMVDRLEKCEVDKKTRNSGKPSDHAPLIAYFKEKQC